MRYSWKNNPCHTRRRSGAVALEFAFVLPILIALLLGIIQYGVIAQTTLKVTNLSREGARFATTDANKADEEIYQYMLRVATNSALNTQDLNVTITPNERVLPRRAVGDKLEIKATYNLKSKFFLPATAYIFLGFPRSPEGDPLYTARATMRIL